MWVITRSNTIKNLVGLDSHEFLIEDQLDILL